MHNFWWECPPPQLSKSPPQSNPHSTRSTPPPPSHNPPPPPSPPPPPHSPIQQTPPPPRPSTSSECNGTAANTYPPHALRATRKLSRPAFARRLIILWLRSLGGGRSSRLCSRAPGCSRLSCAGLWSRLVLSCGIRNKALTLFSAISSSSSPSKTEE